MNVEETDKTYDKYTDSKLGHCFQFLC